MSATPAPTALARHCLQGPHPANCSSTPLRAANLQHPHNTRLSGPPTHLAAVRQLLRTLLPHLQHPPTSLLARPPTLPPRASFFTYSSPAPVTFWNSSESSASSRGLLTAVGATRVRFAGAQQVQHAPNRCCQMQEEARTHMASHAQVQQPPPAQARPPRLDSRSASLIISCSWLPSVLTRLCLLPARVGGAGQYLGRTGRRATRAVATHKLTLRRLVHSRSALSMRLRYSLRRRLSFCREGIPNHLPPPAWLGEGPGAAVRRQPTCCASCVIAAQQPGAQPPWKCRLPGWPTQMQCSLFTRVASENGGLYNPA